MGHRNGQECLEVLVQLVILLYVASSSEALPALDYVSQECHSTSYVSPLTCIVTKTLELQGSSANPVVLNGTNFYGNGTSTLSLDAGAFAVQTGTEQRSTAFAQLV